MNFHVDYIDFNRNLEIFYVIDLIASLSFMVQ